MNCLQTEFSMSDFCRWSLNICLLLNNHFYWWFYFLSKSSICWHAHLLPEFHTKSPLRWHMVTGYQNLSQYGLGNSKSFFCWKCLKYMLRYIIRKYQSFLSKLVYKVKVDWKNSKRSLHVLGLTLPVSLKASKESQQNTLWTSGRCLVLVKALQV